MNHAISPGLVPPPVDLDHEEPEIADELDIPADDPEKGVVPATEAGTPEHPGA